MKTVDPKFCVPSRRLITSDCLPKLHEQIINKLKSVCSLTDFISLTFDGWSDRRMRAFYAVTIHYIDQIGQLKAHLLAFNPLSGKSSYYIFRIISDIFSETFTMSLYIQYEEG